MKLSPQAAFEAPLISAGLQLNGPRDIDPQIHDKRTFLRVLLEGTLGLGESYVEGWWDCEDLAGLISKLLQSGADKGRAGITGILLSWAQNFHNAQSKGMRSMRVITQHYDAGNQLYTRMLDPRMVYTCGFWDKATTLAEAQEAKLDLVCRKLRLQPGQKVLDIGCGFGSFAKFAAEKYGVEVVGITLSQEQLDLGKKMCEGLPVELLFMDYRDLPKHFDQGHFDHIVSIGMFEAVGPKNFVEYMKVASSLLSKKDDGVQHMFLLHTIGGNDEGGFEPWIERYIFPGGHIPSLTEIVKSTKDQFIIEDVQNFGADYDRTLCAWWDNFDKHWSEIRTEMGYTDDAMADRFRRMWRYYLLACAGGFRARRTQLYQFALSHGLPGSYHRPC
jgi:cyclopropane-fatty-acyl-phospholipid synthase